MHAKRNQPPRVVVLAGPNGAGKTTAAPRLLRDTLAVEEFVNADVIAQGISGFNSSAAALAAGRIMLERLKELADARATFAFETTLASRTFAPWLRELIAGGYQFQLVFLWLPSAEMAVARVRDRVRAGGHDVPENVIRRRYDAGIRNFFDLYIPLATSWQLLDNSSSGAPRLVADGIETRVANVYLPAVWAAGCGASGHEIAMATDFTSEQLASQSAAVQAALKLAVRDALIQHKRAGNPICVWREGQVVWIPADEIQIDDEPNGDGEMHS